MIEAHPQRGIKREEKKHLVEKVYRVIICDASRTTSSQEIYEAWIPFTPLNTIPRILLNRKLEVHDSENSAL